MTEHEWVCREADAECPCMKSTGGRPGNHPDCGPVRTITGRIVTEGDHAGDHIGPGDFYDIDQWRYFLSEHGFSIDDVYRVDVNDDGTITVHSYRRGADGRKFLNADGEPATVDPVTLEPNAAIPVWS